MAIEVEYLQPPSRETASWLALLIGHPGKIVIQRDGMAYHIEIDSDSNARVTAVKPLP